MDCSLRTNILPLKKLCTNILNNNRFFLEIYSHHCSALIVSRSKSKKTKSPKDKIFLRIVHRKHQCSKKQKSNQKCSLTFWETLTLKNLKCISAARTHFCFYAFGASFWVSKWVSLNPKNKQEKLWGCCSWNGT